jgi:hypothetical protein
MSEKIPSVVFVVPYRNRIQQKFFFEKHMSFLLEDMTNYEIYISHQHDRRSFNRGAVKNIGFLAIKKKYPDHYRNITFVFNDIDTMPFHKLFTYETTIGVVKHYYGFKHALGGIVVMKGTDFERINGYPNYWAWGNEDNCLQKRCVRAGLKIDRTDFYPIGSPEILQLFDGISRIISRKDHSRMLQDNFGDGLTTLHHLIYTIDKKSNNEKDNIYTIDNERKFIINIEYFLTTTSAEREEYYVYDLREPPQRITRPDFTKRTQDVNTTTEDWKNIPYYPQFQDKRQMLKDRLEHGLPPIPTITSPPQQYGRPQEQKQQQQYPTPSVRPKNPGPRKRFVM